MEEFSYDHYLPPLSNDAMKILRDLMMSLTPYYKPNSPISEFNQYVTIQLFTSLYSTTESAIYLISEYGMWEAELLIRSIIEGTVKYLYILNGTNDEIASKVEEYYITIPEIAQIKRQSKLIDAIRMQESVSCRRSHLREILLSENDIETLKIKYPRKVRIEIEQKWSFSRLLKNLSESCVEYEHLIGLYYSYNFASHLIHQDGDSIKMRQDGMQIVSKNTDYSIEIAHAARQLCDVLSLSLYRVEKMIRINELKRDKYVDKILAVFNYTRELRQLIVECIDE